MFRPLKLCSRSIHTIPKLRFDPAKGVPGLYSPKGFQVAWTDSQNLVLSKLNAAIVDTDNETRVPFHIMQATKARSDLAHVFNYASQAHNNHLFFDNLSIDAVSQEPPKPTGVLLNRINTMYSSLDGLKSAIDKVASKIPASGWVFLVETPEKHLKLVGCNVAGSPTTFSRMQSHTLNIPADDDTTGDLGNLEELVKNRETNWDMELLALNLWQSAYVPDYGVDGRQDYIDKWWKTIDWNKVDSRLFKGRL